MKRRKFISLLGGAVVAWPPALRAQQTTVATIGVLGSGLPGPFAPFMAAFRAGLSEFGYVEGQNLAFEYRWAEGHYDRLPALAADLVGRKVNLISTAGVTAALAAKNATSTIPIVFTGGGDPVESGVIASIARPGGNITGVSTLAVELTPKRFELLSELLAHAGGVALLVNPHAAGAERQTHDVQEAARVKGVPLTILKASSESEIDTVFVTFDPRQSRAILVSSAPLFNSRRGQLVALASRYAIPTMYERREFAAAGGLISYGTSLSSVYHQAGAYAGRILRGEKPADLPVQQPTKFELVINLKTAKALGLTVPPTLLARADEVIE